MWGVAGLAESLLARPGGGSRPRAGRVRMGSLSGFESELAPLALAAGFELIDRELSDSGPQWLEYRRADAAGTLVLSITHAPEARTIVAELWRTERLAEARHGAGPERVAERYATWRYDPEAGPLAVGPEVAAAVAAWLAGLERRGSVRRPGR